MNKTKQSDATVLSEVREAIAAAQAGNKPLARFNFENAVNTEYNNPDYWVWLAWTADSPTNSISALEQALLLDPNHALAQQGLAWARGILEFDVDSYGLGIPPVSSERDEPPAEHSESEDLLAATGDEPAEQDELHTEYEVFDLEHDDSPVVQEEAASQTTSEAKPAPHDSELHATDDAVTADATSQADESVADVELTAGEVVDILPDAFEPASAALDPAEFADQPLDETIDVEPLQNTGQVSECTEDIEIAEAVEEQSDGGSTTEPLELSQVELASDPVAPAAEDQPPTVLAVDDSPTIRKIVAMTLERIGYEVVTASDGMEALEKIAASNPALVLTDISMPKIDGYQLCKLIKSHEKTKAIPVIMLSGKDGMFDKMKGKFVGCNDYITKPFQSSELIDKVTSYLPVTVSEV